MFNRTYRNAMCDLGFWPSTYDVLGMVECTKNIVSNRFICPLLLKLLAILSSKIPGASPCLLLVNLRGLVIVVDSSSSMTSFGIWSQRRMDALWALLPQPLVQNLKLLPLLVQGMKVFPLLSDLLRILTFSLPTAKA